MGVDRVRRWLARALPSTPMHFFPIAGACWSKATSKLCSIFATGILPLALSAAAVVAADEIRDPRATVVVLVEQFEEPTPTLFGRYLSAALPHALIAGILGADPAIKVLSVRDVGNLHYGTPRPLGKDGGNSATRLKVTKRTLQEHGVDFVVDATFVRFGPAYTIEAFLHAVATGVEKKIVTISISADRLLIAMQRLSRRVLIAVREELKTSPLVSSVALGCIIPHHEATGSPTGGSLDSPGDKPGAGSDGAPVKEIHEIEMRFARTLTISLGKSLAADPRLSTVIADDRDYEAFCQELATIDRPPEQWQGADAIVGAKVIFSESEITIEPWLIVQKPAKNKYNLVLPRVTGKFEDYADLRDRFTKGIGQAISALIHDGKWQFDLFWYFTRKREKIKNSPRESKRFIDRAQLAIDNNNFDLASVLLEKIVDYDPENWAAWHDLGSLYLQLDDPERATSVLRQAVSRSPGGAAIWTKLGDAYAAVGAYRDAVDAYGTAAAVGKPTEDLLSKLGQLYVVIEEIDKAFRIYSDLIDRDPVMPDYYLAISSIERIRSNLESATSWLDKGITQIPDNLPLRQAIGELYSDQAYMAFSDGDVGEAIDLLSLEISYNPSDRAYMNRAFVSAAYAWEAGENDNYHDAIADYREVLRLGGLHSQDDEFRRSLARLSISELYLLSGQYQASNREAMEALTYAKLVLPEEWRHDLIAAYIRVVASALHGDEIEEDVTAIRNEISERGSDESLWDFQQIDSVIDRLDPTNPKRHLLKAVLEELRTAPTR